jgi:hypothetical protein
MAPDLMKSLLILPTLAATASGATLVDWTFTGLANPAHGGSNTNVPAGNVIASSSFATTAAGVSAGNIAAGTNGTYSNDIQWSNGNSLASGELNLQNWDLTGSAGTSGGLGGTGDSTPDFWLQFAINADPGQTIELTGISMSAWRNGTGAPEFYRWYYSTNGGTNWLTFGSLYTEDTAGTGSPFETSNYTGTVSASSLLLRFAPTGGSGNIHINDIVLTGNVVPEPTSTLLGALGILGLLRRRR